MFDLDYCVQIEPDSELVKELGRAILQDRSED